MLIEANSSLLYADTPIPDVFITEYLPNLSGEVLKVYMYMLFLSKHNRPSLPKEISKKLELDFGTVKESLTILESYGIIHRTEKSITLVDLKEKEIKKLYRPKTTSTPEELVSNIENYKIRTRTINAISDKYFQGLMSPSWFNDIDNWFEKFKFDEDVMYTLFQHCSDHNGLSRNYVEKVAQSWNKRNIRTSIDLDEYYFEYQKLKDIKQKISKKLKLGRMLTEYEDEYVEKWQSVFKYNFDIIEVVLKKTTGKTAPNFNYINAVLTDWHEKGLKTMEEINEYSKQQTGRSNKEHKSTETTSVRQLNNFKQRDYDKEDLNVYYSNVGKSSKQIGEEYEQNDSSNDSI